MDITETISLLDELRGKCTQGEWKPAAVHADTIIGTTDGKPVDRVADAKYIVALHNALPFLRQAALDGERYRKVAEELEADRNRYREEAEEYSDGVRMSHKAFDDITKKAVAGEVLAISLNGIDTKIGFPPRYEPREIEAFKNGWNSNDDRWSSQRDTLIAAYRQAVEQKEV